MEDTVGNLQVKAHRGHVVMTIYDGPSRPGDIAATPILCDMYSPDVAERLAEILIRVAKRAREGENDLLELDELEILEEDGTDAYDLGSLFDDDEPVRGAGE